MTFKATDKKSPDLLLLDLLIALSPLVVWSFILYGARALYIALSGALAASAAHILISLFKRYAMKKERRIFDLSPVITGLLISLTLPIGVPLHIPALGALFAIVLKELFGGMGRNPLNPALSGRVMLELAFRRKLAVVPAAVPGMDKAAIASLLDNELPDIEIKEMFFGLMDDGIGQMSALLIIISALFLLLRGAIRIETPVAFVAVSAAVSMMLAPDNVSYFRFTGAELLAGGLLFTAVYFASDPVTSPHMFFGRIIFGAAAGALTMLCRLYIGYEGVYIIVLVLGLWSPLLDRLIRPAVFGGLKAPKFSDEDEEEMRPGTIIPDLVGAEETSSGEATGNKQDSANTSAPEEPANTSAPGESANSEKTDGGEK